MKLQFTISGSIVPQSTNNAESADTVPWQTQCMDQCAQSDSVTLSTQTFNPKNKTSEDWVYNTGLFAPTVDYDYIDML